VSVNYFLRADAGSWEVELREMRGATSLRRIEDRRELASAPGFVSSARVMLLKYCFCSTNMPKTLARTA
jgi:hypothetical protein